MDSKLIRDAKTAVTVLNRIVRPHISRVGVSLTYDCNQRCKTCDIWRVNKDRPELRKEEMTLQEFEKFAEVNPKLLWIALTGGEPFLKREMKGFLDACCEIPSLRLISITTNGTIPDKIEDEVLHFLSNKNKNITLAVQISFEGPREIQDEITGSPGSFDRAYDCLQRLNKIKPGYRQLRVGISFTLSGLGIPYLQDTLDVLGDECPNWDEIELGIGQTASYYQWVDDKTGNAVATNEDLVSALKWFRSKFPLKLRLDPYGAISYYYLKKAEDCYSNGRGFPYCVAARYSCSVGPYWDVHPCIFFFHQSLGCLKDYGYDLQALLDNTSETWKQWVKECNKGGGCWNLCESYSTSIFRPWRLL